MYQHLLKQSKNDVGVVLLISAIMALIFGIFTYKAFIQEYTIKQTSNCYKRTHNILCYDDCIGYRPSSSRHHPNGPNKGSSSVLFSSCFFLSFYMLSLSGFVFFKKHHQKEGDTK